MRIVVDLQGAQSLDSRARGVGRYTVALTQALARTAGEHEIILALNGIFPETIGPIHTLFDGLLPPENIKVWYPSGPLASHDSENHWRGKAANQIREAFFASLNPDVVLVCSLFEGFSDDAATSVKAFSDETPTVVILYDLIPHIYADRYLVDPRMNAWYRGKIEDLCRCDLWLAISESSRREGLEYLQLPEDRCISISTDADPYFRNVAITDAQEASIRDKYGLHSPFVMYTGGIDHRKNIDGLINAFSLLPASLRRTHQLAVVCSARPENKRHIEELASKLNLDKENIVVTGFVPEEDLLALYNLCALFVFPSWHEGFGLPALEAMRCGAPVIGSNTSSLPEVIGLADAQFDPHSPAEIAALMQKALTDENFRAALIDNGKARAKQFSWDRSAKIAAEAIERLCLERQHAREHTPESRARKKLAFVSPLPPERSGIADYSADLLPFLSEYYDIEVVVCQESINDSWVNRSCQVRSVDWMIKNADSYDRVIYHFGNSEFHQHMFGLIEEVPGVVVLHDFFLSGILAHMEAHAGASGLYARELYSSHGYKALYERFNCRDLRDVIWQYPCNLSVLQASFGVIVHSASSLRLANSWFTCDSDFWSVIPLMKPSKPVADRDTARNQLGFGREDFVVCTFGMLAPTKLNIELLEAWLRSDLGKSPNCHLVFVGQNDPGEYGHQIDHMVRKANPNANVHITGWVEPDVYHSYLSASDVGVQLRCRSRGETSAAVLDCMMHGVATIINENGSMADIDSGAVWKIPDAFTQEHLVSALESLYRDEALRLQLARQSKDVISGLHNPERCANLYYEAIENFYDGRAAILKQLSEGIIGAAGVPEKDSDIVQLAEALALSFPVSVTQKQILVDVSLLIDMDDPSFSQLAVREVLTCWLQNPPSGYRIEPVYSTSDGLYRYARSLASDLLGIPHGMLRDEPVEYRANDIFIGLGANSNLAARSRGFFQSLRNQRVTVKFVVFDVISALAAEKIHLKRTKSLSSWLEVVSESDGAICASSFEARMLCDWLEIHGPVRQRPFSIEWCHFAAASNRDGCVDGLSEQESLVISKLQGQQVFVVPVANEPDIVVGTVLGALERLSSQGLEVNVLFTGLPEPQGNSSFDLPASLRQRDAGVFWLTSISDVFLDSAQSGIAAFINISSSGVSDFDFARASRRSLPILACQSGLSSNGNPECSGRVVEEDIIALSSKIEHWLNENPQFHLSRKPPFQTTWQDAADQLLTLLVGNRDTGAVSGHGAFPVD